MRFLTHSFAHSETLDRACRWLLHAGIAPDRVQIHREGVPRLAIATDATEVDGIEMIIRAAELDDPDGLLGIWDLARLEPVEAHAHKGMETEPPPSPMGRASFTLAWHPADAAWDKDQHGQAERPRAFEEVWR